MSRRGNGNVRSLELELFAGEVGTGFPREEITTLRGKEYVDSEDVIIDLIIDSSVSHLTNQQEESNCSSHRVMLFLLCYNRVAIAVPALRTRRTAPTTRKLP